MNGTLALAVFFCVLKVFSINSLHAQTTSALPDKVRSSYSIERMGDGLSNEMIQGVPLPGPNVVGNTYIDEAWKKGRILLYGKEKFFDGYTLRYDLYGQLLEVKTTDGIRVVNAARMRSFVTFNETSRDTSVYVNAKEFGTVDGLQGFLQLIEDGAIALMSLPTIYVKRPDYNEALNVGSPDYKIYKKEKLYYVLSGQLKELPTKKKGFLEIFPSDKREQMQQYIREQKLDMSRPSHIAEIFRRYNAILE